MDQKYMIAYYYDAIFKIIQRNKYSIKTLKKERTEQDREHDTTLMYRCKNIRNSRRKEMRKIEKNKY